MPSHNTITRTLMCRDHEVARFSYDPEKRIVTGKAHVISSTYLPQGCLDESSSFSSRRLSRWLTNRAVPATRPGISPVLQRLSLEHPEELLAAGLGLSLSDQYWLRPNNTPELVWNAINCFTNNFSPALGEALAPHDPDSGSRALANLEDQGIVVASSPDSALNGNLPKRWEIRDGKRVLVKSGKPANLFQEPMNERIATLLCARILPTGDFVPYALEQNGYPRYVSSCPCMVDECTEFVPAADVILSARTPNDVSRFEAYARTCEAHGIADIRRQLSAMLVVDHMLANFDRHWGNFGVLIDAETRTWLRAAPIFDTGESLWCDRPLANDFSPYRMPHPMPFTRRINEQLERYASDLSWLDPAALDGFADEAISVLELNRELAAIPGRLDGIRTALQRNIDRVIELHPLESRHG